MDSDKPNDLHTAETSNKIATKDAENDIVVKETESEKFDRLWDANTLLLAGLKMLEKASPGTLVANAASKQARKLIHTMFEATGREDMYQAIDEIATDISELSNEDLVAYFRLKYGEDAAEWLANSVGRGGSDAEEAGGNGETEDTHGGATT